MNFSVLAFFAEAYSTSSNILDAVESVYGFSTFTVRRPLRFIQPDNTLSPFDTSFGMDSPVRALASSDEEPSITTPSKGILSPGFTYIISPTFIL